MFDFFKKMITHGKINGYSVKLADEFLFNVPLDYDHSKQIKVFTQYAESIEMPHSQDLLDENFEHVSYKLEKGGQYLARVFRVGKHWSHFEDNPRSVETIKTHGCLNFLEEQNSRYSNSHFANAQTLSFVWQFIEKKSLKDSNPILAFDDMENIVKNKGRIVAFSAGGRGGAHVTYIHDGEWDPGIYLLYISKITKTTRKHFNESGIRKHTDNVMNYKTGENIRLSDSDDKTKEIYKLVDKYWEKDKNNGNIPDNVLVKTDKVFQISPTDGRANIANSGDKFRRVFFGEDEEVQKSNFISEPTKAVEASVYSLVNDSTIYKMFKSLNKDLNKICLTQSQILSFLEDYRKELVGTWHFLYKVEGGFMFMQVCMDDDGSMRLFGGDFSEKGLDYIYPATGVNFRFLIPEKQK